MRLTHCRLRRVRLHADLLLRFDPGLTLIGGANETGKSTLVEALHRTLFLKASSTGAPVEALRSRLHAGHPEIEVGFEARRDHWTLLKRFSGSSGTVSLRAASGESLRGPEAEERLAELLGVGEMVGSRQAQSVLPTRWAHLWVPQGQSGADPLGAGPAAYDLTTLLPLLEKEGGAALQSVLDQRVVTRVEEQLAEVFTGKLAQVRRQSPLGVAERACVEARAALQEAEDRLSAYNAAGADLARIQERLAMIDQKERPVLEERLVDGRARDQRRRDLQAQLALQDSQLEPLRLMIQSLQQVRDQLQLCDTALQTAGGRLQTLEVEITTATATLEAAGARLAAVHTSRQALEVQQRHLEQRHQQLQLQLELERVRGERDRLLQDLRREQTRERELAALRQRLEAMPPTTAAHVARLRDLELEVRDARTRLGVLAAGVELLESGEEVSLAGEPLQAGQERQLSEVSELRVGRTVRLRISPGGGQALLDVRGQLARAEQALAKGHRFLGVESVEAAEAQWRQRQALELECRARHESAPERGAASLSEALEVLAERLAQLERDLQAQDSGPSEAGGTEVDEPLEWQQARVKATLTAQRQAFQRLDQDASAAGSLLEQSRRELARLEQERAALKADRNVRRERRESLLSNHGGDPERLHHALDALERQHRQGLAARAILTQQLEALGVPDPEGNLKALEDGLQQLRREARELSGQLGAARERCAAIAAGDPHGLVNRCRADLHSAEAVLQSQRRRVEALRLLQDLFHGVRADLSSRYTQPLADAISGYLQPLLEAPSSMPGCQLSYDRTAGFSGLQLRRGPQLFPFAELSGGMKEQLAAALRLSMAEVLRGAHDGSLPLLFDDAFTNSDPDRLVVVRRMLERAVEHGLQVILLSCDPGAYAGLEALRFDLRAPAD